VTYPAWLQRHPQPLNHINGVFARRRWQGGRVDSAGAEANKSNSIVFIVNVRFLINLLSLSWRHTHPTPTRSHPMKSQAFASPINESAGRADQSC
jgi:hypothetical protein